MSPFFLSYSPCAKTATTKTLITNDISNAMHASVKKYIFASRILAGCFRSISRDCMGREKKINK